MSPRRVALAVAVGLYLIGTGVLGGVLIERLRFDQQRASVLTRLGNAEQRLHARLMTVEGQLGRSRAEER